MPKSGSLQDLLTLSLSQQISSPCRYASGELLKDMQGSGQHPSSYPRMMQVTCVKGHPVTQQVTFKEPKESAWAGAESARIKEYKSRQGLQSVSLSVCPSICPSLSLFVCGLCLGVHVKKFGLRIMGQQRTNDPTLHPPSRLINRKPALTRAHYTSAYGCG